MSLRPGWTSTIAAIAVLSVVGLGIAGRVRNERRLSAWTAEHAVPTVAAIRPQAGAGSGDLTLPASLQAWNSAPIHARTTGYVARWLVDIGDKVRRGQLLVVLDAPELEQQLAAARADLQTALANQQLASSTAARWSEMLAADAVSKQDTDEKSGDLAAKKALTDAARANVARLESLTGFTKLVAPFDGVVTSRSAEIGALVAAGDASAPPLFTIADVSRIRAYVRVPQVYSTELAPGMEVRLSLPEHAGRSFAARLARTASAIDPSSGTLLVELEAANVEGALKPGAYARAIFALKSPGDVVTLPPSALIFGERGTQVALLGSDRTVELRSVTLGRDLGTVVEVVAGLKADDSVIDNPPGSLENGDRVRLAGASEGKVDAPR
jgi:RND family efflux transporter MFP subunit